MQFQLKKTFKFVHEPLSIESRAVPFLQNQPAVDKIKERVLNSIGGSFLVTGFRCLSIISIIKVEAFRAG